MTKVSVVIPANNECLSIANVVQRALIAVPESEVIVVDDGSTDDTASLARSAGARVISHPYAKGNGAAIKTGARAATSDVVVFMDGDGQHRPEDIPMLLEQVEAGYDLVVGARSKASQATVARGLANRIYNWLASKIVGHKVEDLTSGFRVVRRNLFVQFLYLLPNGFSYPTTSTMAFFRSGWSVKYVPIVADKCVGNSHISLFKDGVRFLLIIFKVGTLYSPLKLFTPISLVFFITGLGYYLFTYFSFGRFTNMSMLLFSTSMIVFLMGLISEQITALLYSKK